MGEMTNVLALQLEGNRLVLTGWTMNYPELSRRPPTIPAKIDLTPQGDSRTMPLVLPLPAINLSDGKGIANVVSSADVGCAL